MNSHTSPWRSTVTITALAAMLLAVLVLAADQRARVLAYNTLLLSASVSILSLLAGAPLAFLLTRSDVWGRRLAGLLMLALLFMPLYLQSGAWLAGFGMQGWFTQIMRSTPLVEGWRGAIAIHTFAAIPWVVVIVGVGLRLVEPELEEAALLDGTPGQVFRRVTLRQAAQSLGAAALWVAITTAGEMTVTDLFQIRTYAEQLYTEFALGDELGAAPWKTLPSVVATACALAGGLFVTSQLVPQARFASQRPGMVFRLGRWRPLATAATIGLVAVLVGIPAGNLLTKAGAFVTHEPQGFVRGWSLEQCLAMVFESPWRFAREYGWSLLIGALAAVAAVAVGLPLAWSARRGGWRAVPAFLTIAICLALPGPLVGLALIACFNVPDWPWLLGLYDHSIAAVWLAQTIRSLPLCTLVLWYALRTVPAELLESARLDGADGLTIFLRIVLPQRWPAVAAAWLIAFALAWGELAASILVVPPGVMTLPIQIFNLIHYGVDDQVAGVSLFVMGIFMGLALAFAGLVRVSHDK